MKTIAILMISSVALFVVTSCGSYIKPSGWPHSVKPSSASVAHMKEHVKFTGSGIRLTNQEKALLTFLEEPNNIADAIGKKNEPGSHTWSAAEVYRVDPGKHISVLCENGYHQDAVYFHYDEEKKTWFRVKHLGESHSRGVAAVVVAE